MHIRLLTIAAILGAMVAGKASAGEPLLTLESHGGSRAAFSPDGTMLVGGQKQEGGGAYLVIWDARTGYPLHDTKIIWPRLVRWSPNGKAVAADCNWMRLWSMERQKIVIDKKSDDGGEQEGEFAFSPDSELLAIVEIGSPVTVYRVADGRLFDKIPIQVMPETQRLAGPNWQLRRDLDANAARVVVFSPDSRWLYIGTDQALLVSERRASSSDSASNSRHAGAI